MDGWIECDFISFSTVFQSYQDDERATMKGCVSGTLFTLERFPPPAGFEPGSASSF